MNVSDSKNNLTASLSNRQLLGWMFGFLRPVKLRVVLSCLYLILAIAIEVTAVRQTAHIVNEVQRVHANQQANGEHFWTWVSGQSDDAIRLRRITFALVALGGGMALFSYLKEVSNGKLSMHMVYFIREAIYDKLQRAGFAFHDQMSTGELINRSLTDLQNVRQFINTAVLTTLEIVLIVGAYLILLITRSPWVAGLALVPLPLWCWYILDFSRRVQPTQEAVMEASDKNVSFITESIAGIQVIKAFATERHAIASYGLNCDAYLARVINRIRLFANFQPIMRLIATASHLSLFLVGGILMIKRRLQPGDMLVLGSAMGAILNRLQQVSVINDHYQSAIVSAKRLYEVLAHAPSVSESLEPSRLGAGTGAVRIENVTFGYDSQRPVLRDVSFESRGGSTIAIVGPVGAGKTTLIGLIARFYDPQQGRILIDGVDVRRLSLSELRSSVAYVFQETYLFSDSVKANIAYADPDAHQSTIESMSDIAQAHEFVQTLPRGYDTALGERGMTLSGGQRQRLAIARALVSNPRILVLDDATAAVDPETEDLVHRGVHGVMGGRAMFIVAHRISTVKRASQILVLDGGRLTQIGTHKELMRKPGYYRDIAVSQLQVFEEAAQEQST